MGGICLDKISHSCGTRKGLQVFEREDGTVDGYCFSCKTYVRHPYGDERMADSLPKQRFTKTREEIEAEIALKDKDLDIMYVNPVDEPDDKFTFIKLDKDCKPQVLDDVVTMNRLGTDTDRAVLYYTG